MKRVFTLLLCLIVSALLIGSAFPVSASSLGDTLLQTQFRREGVSDAQEFLDHLAQSPADGREWYVLGLTIDNPALDFSGYAQALVQHLAENPERNPVTLQKYALVLLACGYDADFIEQARNESYASLGVMSHIFALHLATAGKIPDGLDTESLITALLSLQKADGGFAVSGETSDVDVTAMALQALAPYRTEKNHVDEAIRRALTLLSERQTENGGFLAYGKENAESAAQVLTALVSLGIDPTQDARFIRSGCTVLDALLSFRTETDGFSHTIDGEENQSATIQAYLALTALDSGTSPYLLDSTHERTLLSASVSQEPPVSSYRPYAILIILGAALAACIILLLLKKRNKKSFLTVAVIALAAMLLVLLTDIQSTDSYYGADSTPRDAVGSVTVSIRCDALVGKEGIPTSGELLSPTAIEIGSTDTVYDVLVEATRRARIHLETQGRGTLAYVEGIAHLYELQYGDLSGWVYTVNGVSADVGCGAHVLSDGDVIEWHYTLDLGSIGKEAP